MMIQTRAIFLDAYRELNSKKLFWIAMILNVVVILLFSMLGANERSLTVFWYELGDMRGMAVPPVFFYKYIFSTVIVGLWFTWAATLLALISTASMFPDFLASGSVDLYLAKPVGRLRLFLTKYLAGLIFVTFQVTVFTGLSFVVLGLRGGIWEFGMFWAIPIVVTFFSYLFGICTLLGVWTRSTVAAILLTVLAWFMIWGVDYIDRGVQDFENNLTQVHVLTGQAREELDRRMAQLSTNPNADPMMLAAMQERRNALATQEAATVVPPALTTTRNVLFGIKSFVPKTRDTIVLLDRVLFKDEELKSLAKQDNSSAIEALIATPSTQPGRRGGTRGGPGGAGRGGPMGPGGPGFLTEQIEADRERPLWWIIGTSLLFEAACVALAARHFCTRDF